VSMLDHKLKPETEPVHRLEVITGTGRRRFSDDDKARIIEETLSPGAVVSEVARRHGLSLQHLFGWRRQARQPSATSTEGGSAAVRSGGCRSTVAVAHGSSKARSDASSGAY
jgi:transposase